MRRVVAWNDAIGRPAGELNHARLVPDVRGFVRLRKRGAGAVLDKIAIQVAIVRGENKWRIAIHAQILRSVSVMAASISANSGKDFYVVAVNEAHAVLGVEFHKFLNVCRINAAVIAAGLSRVARVVAVLLLLDPHRRLGEKVDAAQMVPVGMADDDVSDFVGLDARKVYGFIGANIVG